MKSIWSQVSKRLHVGLNFGTVMVGCGDLIGPAAGKIGELPDGANVAIVGTFSFAGQQQILRDSLAKFGWKEVSAWIRASIGVRLRKE